MNGVNYDMRGLKIEAVRAVKIMDSIRHLLELRKISADLQRRKELEFLIKRVSI
jgi:hypothetical protein